MQPAISHRRTQEGCAYVTLAGHWNLRATREQADSLLSALAAFRPQCTHWDLTRVDDLDVAGATLLWRTWDRRLPETLRLRPGDDAVFRQLAALPSVANAEPSMDLFAPLLRLGAGLNAFVLHVLGVLELMGQVVLWCTRLARHPSQIPFREIMAGLYRSGIQSLAITALVGFLIGIVLSYLSAEQLRDLGADFLIVNLLAVTVLRELGPVLASILNAGRSGSSMTAQIGVMRITNELDAMTVLGISPALRLVLPRVLSQAVAVPLLVLWTDLLAIVGGMFGAKLQLGVSYVAFLEQVPHVVSPTSFLFGIGKGALFGALVALIACHFGLRARPDTEGLATATTESVVCTLTVVLLVDALLAVLFAHVGLQDG
jgi:phospholipid/cholesterol/gamma-HCH transport system permease protein